MIVACPQCHTTFSVPDEAYQPGRRVRCSQCKHVFSLPHEPAEANPVEESVSTPSSHTTLLQRIVEKVNSIAWLKSKLTRKQWVLGGAGLLCLLALLGGGALLYSAYTGVDEAQLVKERRAAREQEALARQKQDALVNSIALVNVRQTVVHNDKIGSLIVIEGYARNDFATPRDYIEVEALLLDDNDNVLSSTRIYCGVSLTLMQLQVLSQDELSKALNNSVEIASNNVDVRTGEQVPFLIVFSGVPKKLAKYEVRPVAARDPQQGLQ